MPVVDLASQVVGYQAKGTAAAQFVVELIDIEALSF